MVSIWNLKDPMRTGYNKLARGAVEVFGTVVRSRKMNKTVSVLVEHWHFNHHYGKLMRSTSLIHCHDEQNFCATGDKVVAHACKPLSPIKHYYIRNIVWHVGRNNLHSNNISQDEIAAMKFNETLRARKKSMYLFADI